MARRPSSPREVDCVVVTLLAPYLDASLPLHQIVSADKPIFLRLIADLFPSVNLAPKVNADRI